MITELIKWMEGERNGWHKMGHDGYARISILEECIAKAKELQAEPERKGVDINEFLDEFEKSDAYQETVAKMQGKVKWAVVNSDDILNTKKDAEDRLKQYQCIWPNLLLTVKAIES